MNLLSKSFYIFLFSSIIFLAGCSSSKHVTDWDLYSKKSEKDFSFAYLQFQGKNFQLAKVKFSEYNFEDTAIDNFESYAFLAECYKQLGEEDSGKVVYEEGIRKIENRLDKRSTVEGNLDFTLDTLKNWFKSYPAFPNSLKRENGFVPYDVMPQVVHIEPPIYPEEAKINGIEGTVYVKILINNNGIPIDTLIVKSSNPIFNEASLNAAMASEFSPYKRKGHNQKTWVMVPFKFALRN